MRKLNDKRVYLSIAIVMLVVAVFLCFVSFYSILIVEPEVNQLLYTIEGAGENYDADMSYKKAYLLLRDPQLFAGYDYFDRYVIKKTLVDFDEKIYNHIPIDPVNDKPYLAALLDRRSKGARLGRNSMVYCLLVSFMFFGAFFFEKKKME